MTKTYMSMDFREIVRAGIWSTHNKMWYCCLQLESLTAGLTQQRIYFRGEAPYMKTAVVRRRCLPLASPRQPHSSSSSSKSKGTEFAIKRLAGSWTQEQYKRARLRVGTETMKCADAGSQLITRSPSSCGMHTFNNTTSNHRSRLVRTF